MMRSVIALLLCLCRCAASFQAIRLGSTTIRPEFSIQTHLQAADENEDGYSEQVDELDELSRPSISFTRNSILFDENAPTQRDNGPLRVWKSTKSVLPALVTGAWDDEKKGDRKPMEHLYNMVFIRIPTVLMALVYSKNLIDGHGLILSFGEVPPIVVFAVFAIILR
mmetsp:Transcript_5516/g.8486  ORF Transcript_5516/g.8486 Transcript_5516/m.8486 type:complete len:167 (-) Transcript_5516:2453-2953(-)